MLAAVDQLYKAGTFKRFGLSNYSAEEVEKVVALAKERNYVLPSVYQGNYNAVARRNEAEILPTLRKHNIALYAYSPVAGGFLTKTSEQLKTAATGRWDPETPVGQLYQKLYAKPALFDALDTWNQIANDAGISNVELAYRWASHNSKLQFELGDGIIVGARNPEQLRGVVAAIGNGPLSVDVVQKIDAIWEKIAGDAPLDNWSK